MNLKIFLFWIAVCPLLVQSQNLNGRYSARDEYFHFYKDSVTFHLKFGGGIVSEYEATGTFQLINNRLVIRPNITEKKVEIKSIVHQQQDNVSIEVQTSNNNKKAWVTITFYDTKGKALYATTRDSSQKIYLPSKYSGLADSVHITAEACIPANFKLQKNCSYIVLLPEGQIKAHYENLLESNNKGLEVKIAKNENQISINMPCSHYRYKAYEWRIFELK